MAGRPAIVSVQVREPMSVLSTLLPINLEEDAPCHTFEAQIITLRSLGDLWAGVPGVPGLAKEGGEKEREQKIKITTTTSFSFPHLTLGCARMHMHLGWKTFGFRIHPFMCMHTVAS